MLFEVNARKTNGVGWNSMVKARLTTNGKIFFGIIAFVIIIYIVVSLMKFSVQPPLTNIYCVPGCSPNQVSIGFPTLVHGCYINQTECQIATQSTTTTTSQPPISEQGTVLVAIKDKSQRVDVVGTLNELFITIKKIEVHFVNQNNDINATGEWKTVFEGNKSVDLLTLTDLVGVISQQNLPSGKYTQIRFSIENVVFNVTNTQLFIKNRRYSAMVVNSSGVPSGELRFVHPFNITAGKTTAVIIDFNVQLSAKKSADGYMLNPVVKITDQILEKGQKPENSVDI